MTKSNGIFSKKCSAFLMKTLLLAILPHKKIDR